MYADVSVLVDAVVGQFEFLERDDRLPGQLVASERRVRVTVETSYWCRVRLAGHDPRRTVIRVPVSAAAAAAAAGV